MGYHKFCRAMAGTLATMLLVCGMAGCAQQQQQQDDGGLKLTYATEGVTVVDDQNALEEAVQKMMKEAEEKGMISLSYKPSAFSKDGINFSGYIGNSERNSYDMFITIFADAELTKQVFLSGLLRPGQGFETITLESALDVGTNVVYVAMTQVESDLKTIHAQTFFTVEFVVEE